MEIVNFNFIFILGILAETTFLSFKKAKKSANSQRKIYLDTSVLIDGRILNIARTGFIGDDLIIPRSVLKELQLLADGADSDKRKIARSGLETASALERIEFFNVDILDDRELNINSVDEILLELAKLNKGFIMTLDYNLIKRAEATKIKTLNINDLSIAVRQSFTTGNKFKITITEKGSEKGQGIGHLSDGTMVVVDKASNKIGQEILVKLAKLHETSAGKIIFAKIIKA